ncbi:putative ATPase with chaperone activity [Rhizobium leguminosarum]|nr:putative ATPase with chaperone activity [Rhizobium leguminosarum]
MQIVGLPDKAVAESRERVQAALHASGLALPAKRVTVNLAPADLPKEETSLPLLPLISFHQAYDKIEKFGLVRKDIDILSGTKAKVESAMAGCCRSLI